MAEAIGHHRYVCLSNPMMPERHKAILSESLAHNRFHIAIMKKESRTLGSYEEIISPKNNRFALERTYCASWVAVREPRSGCWDGWQSPGVASAETSTSRSSPVICCSRPRRVPSSDWPTKSSKQIELDEKYRNHTIRATGTRGEDRVVGRLLDSGSGCHAF